MNHQRFINGNWITPFVLKSGASLLGLTMVIGLAWIPAISMSIHRGSESASIVGMVSMLQAAEPAVTNDAADYGWPRMFRADGHEVIVQAPQIDEWPKFERITFRAAISVGPEKGDTATYGVLRISAKTEVAYDERLVILTERRVEEITFADVEPVEVERLKGIVIAAMPPERPQTVSLDRLVAGLETGTDNIRTVDVNVAPPKIFTSDTPAVLVIFMGKPRFKPVPDSDLLFAINTNWDVFLDTTESKYYLLNEDSWLVTADLEKGPWTSASSLPPSLRKLPNDENWSDVRAAIPGKPAKEIPTVFVSREPAELIVTIGEPEMEPIPGTKLMLVANTESELFYNSAERQYYLLSAGRWFKSAAIAGPWVAASSSMPDDFKNLPDDGEFDDVLASVPGTPAAKEAAIMASIPQKATINRTEVTVNVTYDGAPDFQPIETTTVQYAHNSPFNVFLVDGKYYCCHNAVWFEAPTPTGAWVVCTSVPTAIYTIPPTSPKHNVTYVYVYESTPTTVVTGYTAGYSGATVATTGVVMFGLGLLVGAALADDDDCCWGYHYHSCAFSYGCGAHWHGGYGGYVSGGRYYGPYGGAGRVAAYNPSTGIYSRAGYAYGPNGAAGYRTAYNPSTGVAAGRAGGATPYGSWGRSAVTNGDEWVRGGHRTTARGTVGGIQGSEGGGAITAQGRYGNGATIAKSKDGDYYAAKDGNVYKKGDDGWEQKRNKPTSSRPASTTSTASQASRTRNAELQKQASARSRGERNANRASQAKSGTSSRSAPARGSRGGGGGGGGRRR